MDVVVKGRHTEVGERFRAHVADKLAKVSKLDGKVNRIDVEVCEEHNPRLAGQRSRVELTCRTRGPVVRAEAAAADPYAALDLAVTRLEARLRRAADRRRVHHGIRTPVSVAAATAATLSLNGSARTASAANGAAANGSRPDGQVDGHDDLSEAIGDASPFVVREKVHPSAPMTLDQALFEMELVGHDFFLYDDLQHGVPSVVYRRRGYDYGVIRLVRSGGNPG